MLTPLLPFMLDIYRVYYRLILMKFAQNYVDMVYHTLNFSGEDFKYISVH